MDKHQPEGGSETKRFWGVTVFEIVTASVGAIALAAAVATIFDFLR